MFTEAQIEELPRPQQGIIRTMRKSIESYTTQIDRLIAQRARKQSELDQFIGSAVGANIVVQNARDVLSNAAPSRYPRVGRLLKERIYLVNKNPNGPDTDQGYFAPAGSLVYWDGETNAWHEDSYDGRTLYWVRLFGYQNGLELGVDFEWVEEKPVQT